MIKIKRPLVTILIGAIVGIIYGLYLKISIAITIILIALMLYLIQKNKSKAFYFVVKRRKLIIIFLISIIISSLYIFLINNKYQKIYKKIPQNIITEATVISEARETEYYNSYEIKIQNKKFILYVKKSNNQNLKYGMKIKIEAEYSQPQESRNYKGFSYKEYLKTKKIYGSFRASKITIIKENDVNMFLSYSNKFRNKIIQTIKDILPEDTEGLMIGILIGDNEGISEEITENFSKSSLSHIVAISGSHITYIVVGLSYILNKSKLPKKGIHIITILALIVFMFITRFSPSVVRACIMGIIMLFAKIVYRKLDILNSIALSLLILLIYNPYSINDIGLQLSYAGTLGIVFLNKPISEFLQRYMNKKIAEILSVTVSAQIAVLPITVINFNTISTVFVISNLLAVPLSGVITILGYASAFIGIIFLKLGNLMGIVLSFMTKILILIAEVTAQIPFGAITVTTPSIIFVVLYYLILGITCIKFNKVKNKNEKVRALTVKKDRLSAKKVSILFIGAIFIIIFVNIIPQNLKIHFIDVGQRRLHANKNPNR